MATEQLTSQVTNAQQQLASLQQQVAAKQTGVTVTASCQNAVQTRAPRPFVIAHSISPSATSSPPSPGAAWSRPRPAQSKRT